MLIGMKRLLSLCIFCLLFAVPVSADVIEVFSLTDANKTQSNPPTIGWDDINAEYGEMDALVYDKRTYADGTPLAIGERVRCFAVATMAVQGEALAEEIAGVKKDLPIEMDALGNVTATGILQESVVIELKVSGNGGAIGEEGYVGASRDTFPDAKTTVSGQNLTLSFKNEPSDLWDVSPLRATEALSARQFYFFVVVEDTRDAQGQPQVNATDRMGYGVSLVLDDPLEWLFSTSFSSFTPYIRSGSSMEPTTGSKRLFLGPMTFRTATDPATYTAQDGTVYEGEDLEALLSPAIGALATDASGQLALTLATDSAGNVLSSLTSGETRQAALPVPDLLRYSVLTTDTLGGTWQSLDTFVKEKNLDSFADKVYTRCRLSELKSLVLPTVPAEKARFYKLERAQ